MTVRRGTVGTGLTEKTSFSWDGGSGRDDPEIAAILETGTLDGLIASVERTCFDILVSAGLPGAHGCYAYKSSGEWKLPSGGDFSAGWSLANTVEPVAKARGFAPDSPVGFAAAMMDRIHWLRDNQGRGDHGRAALFAFYLGVLRAESRIKLEHEPVWKSGKGAVEGAKKGAEAKRTAVEHRNKRIRATYEERLTRQSRALALQCTAKDYGLGEKQTRRIVGPQ